MKLKNEISESLYDNISKKYEIGLFSDSVLGAIKQLTEIIRTKSGLDGDGTSLVGQAFGGDTPKIRINGLKTASDKDEQKGFEQLMRGLYTSIRNPRTHDTFTDTQQIADSIIIFVDYLYGKIQRSKSQFNLEDYKNRVFDPLFVARYDYAELIVNEIPKDELVNTVIEILKNRNRGESEKLEFFFNAVFNVADNEQRGEIVRNFSNQLQKVNSDQEIINIIRYLQPKLWPELNDDVKFRIETKIIESVSNAHYDMYKGLKDGALGTWASNIGEYFKLRHELGEALITLLNRNWYTQNYIGHYFIFYLNIIIDDPSMMIRCCQGLINATMNNNAKHLKYKLKENFSYFPSKWRDYMLKYAQKYKDNDSEYYDALHKASEDDDDLPF